MPTPRDWIDWSQIALTAIAAATGIAVLYRATVRENVSVKGDLAKQIAENIAELDLLMFGLARLRIEVENYIDHPRAERARAERLTETLEFARRQFSFEDGRHREMTELLGRVSRLPWYKATRFYDANISRIEEVKQLTRAGKQKHESLLLGMQSLIDEVDRIAVTMSVTDRSTLPNPQGSP